MKPVVNYLRARGFVSVIYLDDILCLGDSEDSCSANSCFTRIFLETLGFIINAEKSSVEPARRCKYLDFIVNSVNWTVELPLEKRIDLSTQISRVQNKRILSIREFTQLIGALVAGCPGV